MSSHYPRRPGRPGHLELPPSSALGRTAETSPHTGAPDAIAPTDSDVTTSAPTDSVLTKIAPTAGQLAALFDAHAVQLASALLGCELTVITAEGAVTVRITEVEAYGDQGEDPGAHSYNGPTIRNASLFGPPRHTYVYLSYGIHMCLNLVANAEGAGGVLLRAAEVVSGRDLAVTRRGGKDTGAKLLSGPGRLGQGLGIQLSMDKTALFIEDRQPSHPHWPDAIRQPGRPGAQPLSATEATFRLTPPSSNHLQTVLSGPRVGVSGQGGSHAFPWRFWCAQNTSVSAYRPGKNVPQQAP